MPTMMQSAAYQRIQVVAALDESSLQSASPLSSPPKYNNKNSTAFNVPIHLIQRQPAVLIKDILRFCPTLDRIFLDNTRLLFQQPEGLSSLAAPLTSTPAPESMTPSSPTEVVSGVPEVGTTSSPICAPASPLALSAKQQTAAGAAAATQKHIFVPEGSDGSTWYAYKVALPGRQREALRDNQESTTTTKLSTANNNNSNTTTTALDTTSETFSPGPKDSVNIQQDTFSMNKANSSTRLVPSSLSLLRSDQQKQEQQSALEQGETFSGHGHLSAKVDKVVDAVVVGAQQAKDQALSNINNNNSSSSSRSSSTNTISHINRSNEQIDFGQRHFVDNIGNIGAAAAAACSSLVDGGDEMVNGTDGQQQPQADMNTSGQECTVCSNNLGQKEAVDDPRLLLLQGHVRTLAKALALTVDSLLGDGLTSSSSSPSFSLTSSSNSNNNNNNNSGRPVASDLECAPHATDRLEQQPLDRSALEGFRQLAAMALEDVGHTTRAPLSPPPQQPTSRQQQQPWSSLPSPILSPAGTPPSAPDRTMMIMPLAITPPSQQQQQPLAALTLPESMYDDYYPNNGHHGMTTPSSTPPKHQPPFSPGMTPAAASALVPAPVPAPPTPATAAPVKKSRKLSFLRRFEKSSPRSSSHDDNNNNNNNVNHVNNVTAMPVVSEQSQLQQQQQQYSSTPIAVNNNHSSLTTTPSSRWYKRGTVSSPSDSSSSSPNESLNVLTLAKKAITPQSSSTGIHRSSSLSIDMLDHHNNTNNNNKINGKGKGPLTSPPPLVTTFAIRQLFSSHRRRRREKKLNAGEKERGSSVAYDDTDDDEEEEEEEEEDDSDDSDLEEDEGEDSDEVSEQDSDEEFENHRQQQQQQQRRREASDQGHERMISSSASKSFGHAAGAAVETRLASARGSTAAATCSSLGRSSRKRVTFAFEPLPTRDAPPPSYESLVQQRQIANGFRSQSEGSFIGNRNNTSGGSSSSLLGRSYSGSITISNPNNHYHHHHRSQSSASTTSNFSLSSSTSPSTLTSTILPTLISLLRIFESQVANEFKTPLFQFTSSTTTTTTTTDRSTSQRRNSWSNRNPTTIASFAYLLIELEQTGLLPTGKSGSWAGSKKDTLDSPTVDSTPISLTISPRLSAQQNLSSGGSGNSNRVREHDQESWLKLVGDALTEKDLAKAMLILELNCQPAMMATSWFGPSKRVPNITMAIEWRMALRNIL